jgi:uroporphyrinogen-III synthase
VLVPRAEGGRDEAIAVLRDAQVEVDAVVVYRTVPAAADDPGLAAGLAALRGGAVAVCAVFAPSQVRALDALFGIRRISAVFAAIGETTAAALRAAGAGVVVVAEEPTPERLAKAVSAVYPLRS